MVKKSFFIALSATFPIFLAAGAFIASVSSNQVQLGEPFSLHLTLKDSSPQESPTISALKEHFLLHSQQQSNNTLIVNGKASLSIAWKLSLTPKTEGVVQIPPITIATEEGLLATEPITLYVTRGATDSTGPNLSSKVSNAFPYKNEPLLYTALLTSKTPLYNVQGQKIQVDDAIVELAEEPKLEERVIDGVSLYVVAFTYLITPLKTGSLTIPPITIQGALPQKRKDPSHFFNDAFDSFAALQGFDRFKPFTLVTDEIELDVQPPLAEVSPWLPATDLTLEEHWPSGQTLRVGEPFSRGFLIKAEGLKASQLPHLDNLSGPNSPFKVYADKPEEQEKVSGGIIHSMRKEYYTLIPQEAGTCVLPEISISWWDSLHKQKRVSTIPAHTVQILPALQQAASSPPPETTSPPPTTAPLPSVRPPFFLYTLIGLLTCLLASVLLWGYTLQRKIARLTPAPTQKPTKPLPPPVPAVAKEKKEKLPDLNPT